MPAPAPLPANTDTARLTKFLRDSNQKYPFINEALLPSMEGNLHLGYDCKGSACLYARDMLEMGADLGDMKGLIVETGHQVKHMILQYRDVCLDNSQSFLTKPSDYTVLQTLSWVQLELFALRLGIPLGNGPVFAKKPATAVPPTVDPQTVVVKATFWGRVWAAIKPWVTPT